VFPNVTIALRISVSLPASVASGERTFHLLQQVKNYYCSSTRQDGLNGFATISIKRDLAGKLDFPQ
jgi:hypothetical protein